ncbi:pyridoxine/pyridoxal/pyridoxamine kinase [Entomohabitans teleogrylli]|uniref:pyridoxine/pyridoxal/pyridoxamine kinase n=1 Tax=Entomohabitans teleogrylli TaxID=1384589 RepID=UPI00073D59C6|nr:pyridoxine/pyridoxal/pyridoxamine kinase [Entomohabitans teleogrylli]
MENHALESDFHPQGAALCDVISVQSQVVFGSVGNSIAVPALQRHDLRVTAVPTVILSNTPHYATCYGGPLPGEWFEGFLHALVERDVVQQTRAIVTGYLGALDRVDILSAWLTRVRQINPQALIVIDPVLGDTDSGFYVPPALAEAYRHALVHFATGITPNSFELSCLHGAPLTSLSDTIDAARGLLNGNLQWVVVTSAAPDALAGDRIQAVCVTRDDATIVTHNKLPVSPKGTGDLFSAELTAALLSGLPLSEAVRGSCQRVEEAILCTWRSGSKELCLPPR